MVRRTSIFSFLFLTLMFLFSSAFAGQWGEFTYAESDEAVTIIGYGCPDGPAVIPNIIGDKPVARIGYEAFFNCSGMTSVTIPNSVITIDERAFYGCTGLTSVTIPDSVRKIGHHAFHDCTGLSKSPVRAPGSLVIVNRFE